MSEQQPPAAVPGASAQVPAVPSTPAPAPVVTAPATPPAPDPAPPPGTITLTSEQLNERLERERRSWMTALGIDNVEDGKKAFAAYKAAQDAQKSEAERTAERLRELDQTKAQASAYAEVIKQRADFEMARLNDSQRAAVKAIAGDSDHAGQLRAITALTPTWASAPPAPAPAAPAAPPATTAQPPAAPAPAGSGGTTDHKAVYEKLCETNPWAARSYLNLHARQIFPTP